MANIQDHLHLPTTAILPMELLALHGPHNLSQATMDRRRQVLPMHTVVLDGMARIHPPPDLAILPANTNSHLLRASPTLHIRISIRYGSCDLLASNCFCVLSPSFHQCEPSCLIGVSFCVSPLCVTFFSQQKAPPPPNATAPPPPHPGAPVGAGPTPPGPPSAPPQGPASQPVPAKPGMMPVRPPTPQVCLFVFISPPL